MFPVEYVILQRFASYYCNNELNIQVDEHEDQNNTTRCRCFIPYMYCLLSKSTYTYQFRQRYHAYQRQFAKTHIASYADPTEERYRIHHSTRFNHTVLCKYF